MAFCEECCAGRDHHIISEIRLDWALPGWNGCANESTVWLHDEPGPQQQEG